MFAYTDMSIAADNDKHHDSYFRVGGGGINIM